MSPLPRLHVSDNHRFLVDDSKRPFFWLGDTAWELFHRLTREEATRYLKDRAAKGFNVIQAVLLAEFDGLTVPNAYGQLPLIDQDPTRPNDAYFCHVDDILTRAEALGLYVGLLPTWGKYVSGASAEQRILNAAQARIYGEYLGDRYRDRAIIWILGGDVPPLGYEDVWRCMAEGLIAGDEGRHLITYHPSGWAPADGDSKPGHISSDWLASARWIDVHMGQSCHFRKDQANYGLIASAYAAKPTHPCLDGEPNYEHHPIDWKPQQGLFDDLDVRKAAYWSVFAGSCGHTYGCHEIWQFYSSERQPISSATMPWPEAMALPGSLQLRHLRALMLSRPYLTRIPDQELILSDIGKGPLHIQATRDGTPYNRDATYLMAYLPTSVRVTVDTSALGAETLRGFWYDPRDGTAQSIGDVANSGSLTRQPPTDGRDWVLVIDDASAKYPTPGSHALWETA